MTNPDQAFNNPSNSTISASASSVQLSVVDNKDGTLGILGSVIGSPAGTEISILIADAEGNTTSIAALVGEFGSYEALVTDISMLKPGANLVATGKVDNLSVDAPFELEGMAELDPILITNSAINGANQISLNGLAPSLKVDDVLTLVIRDKNGTSTDVTAVVQQGGVFSLTGISTQGLVDGPLVIDVQAQTTETNISVVNAATLQLTTQLPAGTDKTVSASEDTGFALAASDFGYDASAGYTMTGIKIAGIPSLGTLKYNGISVTVDQFVSVADLAAGKLVFLAAPNANGNAYANFMFKVLDSRSGINEDPVANTITFNVAAVNDMPVVTTAGAITTVNEDSANATAATLWSTAPAFGQGGGSDESSQTLTARLGQQVQAGPGRSAGPGPGRWHRQRRHRGCGRIQDAGAPRQRRRGPQQTGTQRRLDLERRHQPGRHGPANHYGAEYGFEVGRSYTQYTSGGANLFVDQTLLQAMV